jgi:hypothetical protein
MKKFGKSPYLNNLDVINLMIEENYKIAYMPRQYADYGPISKPERFTINLSANMSGINFNEETFKLVPNANTVQIVSNYDEIAGPLFVETKPRVMSTRGRKPKEKVIKLRGVRKVQGSGKCFCSQITIIVLLPEYSPIALKIKVFRTGSIQIPGLNNDQIPGLFDYFAQINEIFTAYTRSLITSEILAEFNNGRNPLEGLPLFEPITDIVRDLAAAASDPAELVQILENHGAFTPVALQFAYITLENYKFRILDDRLTSNNHILNLEEVASVFTRVAETTPTIADVIYIENNSFVTVNFRITFLGVNYKKVSVVIYSGGKINVRACVYHLIDEIYAVIARTIMENFGDNWLYSRGN